MFKYSDDLKCSDQYKIFNDWWKIVYLKLLHRENLKEKFRGCKWEIFGLRDRGKFNYEGIFVFNLHKFKDVRIWKVSPEEMYLYPLPLKNDVKTPLKRNELGAVKVKALKRFHVDYRAIFLFFFFSHSTRS